MRTHSVPSNATTVTLYRDFASLVYIYSRGGPSSPSIGPLYRLFYLAGGIYNTF